MYLFLYPQSYIKKNSVEEMYESEFNAMKSHHFDVAVFDVDNFNNFDLSFVKGKTVIYRGWMFNIEDYHRFYEVIQENGGQLITTPEQYKNTHYIPEWYPLVKELTPVTHCFHNISAARAYINNHSEQVYFVKDFVKSLRTGIGSFISNVDDFDVWVEESIFYKGQIEGGICLREVESFVSETEFRYFVFNKNIYKNSLCPDETPDIVYEIAQRINSPFFSIDIIKTKDGKYRLVEIGDGQVSSSETWDVDYFTNVFSTI